MNIFTSNAKEQDGPRISFLYKTAREKPHVNMSSQRLLLEEVSDESRPPLLRDAMFSASAPLQTTKSINDFCTFGCDMTC